MRIALFIGLLGSSPLLAANAAPDFNDWQKACSQITASPIVEPQFNGPLQASQLPTCDSLALYYGFGSAPDYPAALQCAWYERSHTAQAPGEAMHGPGILTMLYANGRGTRRDIDLAMHFACEIDAPAEMSNRLIHLDEIRDEAAPAQPFDLCDDVISTLMGTECVYVQSRYADAERDRQLAQITTALSPAQHRLFQALRAAEDKFVDVRTGNELDLTGSLRNVFYFQDRAKLLDQFLLNLRRFSTGAVPATDAAGVAKLDAEMNALYQRIVQAPDSTFQGTTVKSAGVRDTQRAWLGLRDAWLQFARAAYPHLTSERVQAQLIRLRLNQLRRLPIDLK